MNEYPAGSIKANDVLVPITVDDQGDWSAEYDGRTLSYPTREKLENSLKRLTKRAAVTMAVPVVKIEESYAGAKGTRATITGVHGANGNLLVILHKGGRQGDVKEQVSARYLSQAGLWFGGDVTDEQIAEYSALIVAERNAREARQAMRTRLSVDIFKATERGLEAVSGSGEEGN